MSVKHRPLFIIDAFTEKPYCGNPASVLLLSPDDPLSAGEMQRIAQEMNHSETAFVHLPAEKGGRYGLRWFTPMREIDLCGHATLAAAHALYDAGRVSLHQPIEFETRSGVLRAAPDSDWRGFWIDLPATPPRQATPPPAMMKALGISSADFIGLSLPPDGTDDNGETDFSDWFIVLDHPQQVREVAPDFDELKASTADRPNQRGVIVTARGDSADADVVSRCFYPAYGIDEDPVTGSAHCTIAPYFARELCCDELRCHQASGRGGSLRLRFDRSNGSRVHVGGRAVTTVRGELVV